MMTAPTLLSDEELLRQVAGGNSVAYTTLYQRYHTRLSRFLTSWFNDQRKTEDLTQEVLLEVWKNAGTYRGLSQASTWILGIARFKALTARRRQFEVFLSEAETTQIQEEDLYESPE